MRYPRAALYPCHYYEWGSYWRKQFRGHLKIVFYQRSGYYVLYNLRSNIRLDFNVHVHHQLCHPCIFIYILGIKKWLNSLSNYGSLHTIHSRLPFDCCEESSCLYFTKINIRKMKFRIQLGLPWERNQVMKIIDSLVWIPTVKVISILATDNVFFKSLWSFIFVYRLYLYRSTFWT